MPEYRFYIIEKDCRVAGLPRTVLCRDDNEAIEEAKRTLHSTVEIWSLARRVVRLESAADG